MVLTAASSKILSRRSRSRREGFCGFSSRGFTLIELMVVIGIIVMAAALMAPSVAEYMKNRQIDGVRGQLVNIFNIARLQAVSKRRDISVVFFREGPRIFDELSQDFTDDDVWSPQTSVLGQEDGSIWYVLGFARGATSFDERFDDAGSGESGYKPKGLHIPPFESWRRRYVSAKEAGTRGNKRRGRSRSTEVVPRYQIKGLYKLTFRRDGSLEFGAGGADVPTTTYNDDAEGAPSNSDLVVLQVDGSSAVYIDLRPTGQVRSKLGVLADPPLTRGELGPVRAATRGSKKSSRKR